MRDITLEMNSVHGVTKKNFDAVVSKLEELYEDGVKKVMKEALGDDNGSIWPPEQSPEQQKKGLEEQDEIHLYFLKVRE